MNEVEKLFHYPRYYTDLIVNVRLTKLCIRLDKNRFIREVKSFKFSFNHANELCLWLADRAVIKYPNHSIYSSSYSLPVVFSTLWAFKFLW